MSATLWWVLALVVVLIVGPFATLRAVSHVRSRRTGKPLPPSPPAADQDEDDPDKPTGFW